MGFLTLDQLNYDTHPYFEGLHLLPNNIGKFYNRGLVYWGQNLWSMYHDGASSKKSYTKRALKCNFCTWGKDCRKSYEKQSLRRLRLLKLGRVWGSSRLDRPGVERILKEQDHHGLSECQSNKRAHQWHVEAAWSTVRRAQTVGGDVKVGDGSHFLGRIHFQFFQ